MSNILGNNEVYLNALNSWLSSTFPAANKWSRCYRGKSHGWNAQQFHNNCDNKGPTVTLVRVGDAIFGGFLDQNWGGNKILFCFRMGKHDYYHIVYREQVLHCFNEIVQQLRPEYHFKKLNLI